MRRINSKFQTKFLSEEGYELINRDYFAYVELDQFACYVLADGLDEDHQRKSAEVAVSAVLSCFTEEPGIGKRHLKRYLFEAQRALRKAPGEIKPKASLLIVVTDYGKLRYLLVGNCRFYLLRNDSFLVQSRDQSYTIHLVEEEKLSLDKAALHEERNNLYCYLGQKQRLQPVLSKSYKLEDGDIFYLFSRGIWEHCGEGEFLDASMEAKEPQEILDRIEDLILSKQPESVDNYTLAVTFVQKRYRNPKKKWTWKKILLLILPIVILLIMLFLFLFFQQKKEKRICPLWKNTKKAEEIMWPKRIIFGLRKNMKKH